MPPRPGLQRIRQSLLDDVEGFDEIVLAHGFKRRFGALDPELMLTRMPRGYDESHPAAKWLRFQSFIAGAEISPDQALSTTLPGILARYFEALAPMVRWLNDALGLKRSTAR
jgi:uncharacterized protein (DUF2461 family)